SREAKAAGIASNVRFIGYIDREHELPQCYAAADVFMFSSRTETQGLVLIEAMACGLPVVALAEMGTRDILNSNRGALTPAAEIETFAQAVASLIDNPERRRQLSAEARDYSLEWSDAAMAARLADLYRACLRR
ncbi:glycosyltransferase, partial [Azoarcus taiwanensis]